MSASLIGMNANCTDQSTMGPFQLPLIHEVKEMPTGIHLGDGRYPWQDEWGGDP